jgi:hypothetical protein
MRTKARHYYPPIKKCRGSTLRRIRIRKWKCNNTKIIRKWSLTTNQGRRWRPCASLMELDKTVGAFNPYGAFKRLRAARGGR